MTTPRSPNSDYRALVAVHGDVSTVATPEGRFAYVAPSSLRLLGWQPSALQGRDRTDFVHPLIASGAAAYLTKPLDISEFLALLDELLVDAEF